MTDRHYDAVLWDFGGVFTPSPFLGLRRWADEQGIDHDLVIETMFGPYGDDTDHMWHRLERGQVTMADAMGSIADDAVAKGIALDPDNPFAFMRTVIDGADRSGLVEVVRAVKAAGLRQAVVTNNVAEIGDLWRSLLPVDELFDTVVDSSAVGIRKPDHRIYRLALDRLGGVEPSRAVFVDDFEANVAAAEAVGLTGVLVTDTEPLAAGARVRTLVGLD